MCVRNNLGRHRRAGKRREAGVVGEPASRSRMQQRDGRDQDQTSGDGETEERGLGQARHDTAPFEHGDGEPAGGRRQKKCEGGQAEDQGNRHETRLMLQLILNCSIHK